MWTKPSAKESAKPRAAATNKLADKVSASERQLQTQLTHALQENELLMLQLMQAQEELLAYHDHNLALESKANQSTKADSGKLAQLSADNAKLKAEIERLGKVAKQAAKLQDTAQDNELLMLQLLQAQEELVLYHEQKGRLEELYTAYKARWERLEKRQPNYVDFGVVELSGFDNVADIPSLNWRIKDYAHAGVAIPELEFTTFLHDGHPGIGLLKPGFEPACFVPRLLTTSTEYLKNFMNCSTTQFQQISDIVPIFEQLEASNWQGFEFPANFDASFWRPSLKTLMLQIKALPPVLRYDQVLLKRELVNPDYEHLWLEFRGLALGTSTWRKFEVRLGAALLQPFGFSQYPKFEFPLIDGKTKPFESWYAESYDDSGPKLELRFALDKQAVDTAVLTKLTEADRGLVLRLVNAFPDALLRLEAQKTAIHRPWSTWVDFARGAVALLQASRNAPGAVPAAESASNTPAQTATSAQPTKLAPATQRAAPSGLRVLNFKSKPSEVKPKTTTTTKAVPKNNKRKEA